MAEQDGYRITTVEQLSAIIGTPNPLTPKKVSAALDEYAIEFVARAPFLVIGTSDGEGNLDVSPKGDGPGFVAVEDAHTLLIPERKGNKLMFGFRNILSNPHVGLIFMVPGTNETLRVNGFAEITADPALLARLTARGAPALLAMRVTVRECFFHCAKAFIRSALWKPASWSEPMRISFGKILAQRAGMDADGARIIDQAIAQDYKNNL
jgi:PPOX class probable FMN-dependent enzyme